MWIINQTKRKFGSCETEILISSHRITLTCSFMNLVLSGAGGTHALLEVCYFSTHRRRSRLWPAVPPSITPWSNTEKPQKINTRLRSVSKSSSDLLGKCFQNYRRLLRGFGSSQSALNRVWLVWSSLNS